MLLGSDRKQLNKHKNPYNPWLGLVFFKAQELHRSIEGEIFCKYVGEKTRYLN